MLLAALVMLIALMLGASALMRMVESANLLSGNLAFKRAATLAAEAGAEAAIGWLGQQDAAALAQDHPALGYYANDAANFDAAGHRSGGQTSRVDLQADNCAGAAFAGCLKTVALPGPDAAGHTVRYVVQRLCAAAGPHASSGSCAFHLPAEAESSSRTGLGYGRSQRLAGAPVRRWRFTGSPHAPADRAIPSA